MRQPKNWEAARAVVLHRDRYVCQICHEADATDVDHIWPRSAGGPDELDNLRAACGPCNKRKGNRYAIQGADAQQLMWLANHLVDAESKVMFRASQMRRALRARYPVSSGEELTLTLGVLTKQKWLGPGYGLISADQIAETSAEVRQEAEDAYRAAMAECDAADRMAAAMREDGHDRLRDRIMAIEAESDAA